MLLELKEPKYQADIYNECTTGKSDWICKSCHNSMSKNKIAMQGQVNNRELCPTFSELDRLYPIRLMLISQIIPFMFIVAKRKGAQPGLKGQCVLVPADLEKIQTILPRSCDEYLISLALKRRLTDKNVVNKQQIRPTLVNTALQKLAQINPFYNNITILNELEDLSEQSDPVLWKLLTDKNAQESNNIDQMDSDDDIEGNDKFKERELKESLHIFQPSCIMLMDQTYLPMKLLIWHLEKVKFLFLLLRNLIGKHLHFLKTIPQEETTLMRKEKSQ